ncbi:hypothetical protein LCGC14_2323440 [marine sediment metagenome]|uniref:Uncharacterized protein n=1 Tax=marine sediment metagenome TaxID=412755 RepID=A0A0F9CHN3_9ZZZZ
MANLKNLFNRKRFTDLSILAAVVVVIQYILSAFVYPMFGKATQTLFAITPATAISGTLGTKILGFLSGIIPFDLGNITAWISLFLGALVLLFVGYFVYEQKWAWKGKNITQRLWAILLYGSAALYVFLLVTKIDAVAVLALPLLIGVAVNYFVIAVVVSLLARQFKFLRI